MSLKIILTLDMFKEVIELGDFVKSYQDYMKPGVVVVFTQMWLDLDSFSPEIYHVPNFIFLNVENLTEQKNAWTTLCNLFAVVSKSPIIVWQT